MTRCIASINLKIAFALWVWPELVLAAAFDGAAWSAWWGLPFVGLLLSIAILPIVALDFWHCHSGKVVIVWVILFLAPFAMKFGSLAAVNLFTQALIEEYVPFIVLLTALYTVAGGIYIRGTLHGSPCVNTTILMLGIVLSSIMGTTGAAMLLIRPLLRANDNRKHVVHIVIFFIFLVANVGGSLSPLGDPPLFIGFLNGVSFFWTTQHLALLMLFICGVLLILFYMLDSYYFHYREKQRLVFLEPTRNTVRFSIDGVINLVLLAGVASFVLISGLWNPKIEYRVLGLHVVLQNVVRDAALVAIMLLSLVLTPQSARMGNSFNWSPIKEVAKIFTGIFITIVPVNVILRAGDTGAFSYIVHLINDTSGKPRDAAYFWATGMLSSFLDNAPTYLVFFNLAGGDAPTLMTTGATTLAAISAGAVFMGANSYIGNAPNFMVKAIAESHGICMPSFFGYILWVVAILVPVFLIATWLFF